jgi:hypothetical protein
MERSPDPVKMYDPGDAEYLTAWTGPTVTAVSKHLGTTSSEMAVDASAYHWNQGGKPPVYLGNSFAANYHHIRRTDAHMRPAVWCFQETQGGRSSAVLTLDVGCTFSGVASGELG